MNNRGVTTELELERDITAGLKDVIYDLIRATPTASAICEKFNLSPERATEIEAIFAVIHEEKENT